MSLTTLRRLIIQSFCREHLKVGQKLGIFRDEIFKSKIQSFSCLRTERTEKFMTTAQQEGNSNGPRPASFIWVDERLGGYYFANTGIFLHYLSPVLLFVELFCHYCLLDAQVLSTDKNPSSSVIITLSVSSQPWHF